MTMAAAYYIINHSPKIEELDLQECKPLEGDLDLTIRGPASTLKYLNLRNSPVNDSFVRFAATQCPQLKTLILESCAEISDSSIMKVANSCLELNTLDLSFCHLVTDLSLQVFTIRASSNNGGNLQVLNY